MRDNFKNPYIFNNLEQLIRRAHRLAWYGGLQTLLNLTIKGQFEGWTMRATEDWELRYYLSSDGIINDGKEIWPKFHEEGETIDEVCQKVLLILKDYDENGRGKITKVQP